MLFNQIKSIIEKNILSVLIFFFILANLGVLNPLHSLNMPFIIILCIVPSFFFTVVGFYPTNIKVVQLFGINVNLNEAPS